MPEASIVRILLMGLFAKRRLNSSPIWRNRRTSIWWFKKLSTFNILPAFTTPSLTIRSSRKFILFCPPRFLLILLYRSGTGMSIPNAHRKQLQNFIRNRVVHETGSHIFLPFIRNFRERHLQISAGGNILFGNGANHGKDFFCFNSSYPTVRRILHGTRGQEVRQMPHHSVRLDPPLFLALRL